ncbi:hypothetical protein Tco_0556676 [Tanacetum coccineum]
MVLPYGPELLRLYMGIKVFLTTVPLYLGDILGLISSENNKRIPRGGIEEDHLRLLKASTSTLLLPQIFLSLILELRIYRGNFSVKSVHIFIDDSMLPKEEVSTRWVKCIPIKARQILSKVARWRELEYLDIRSYGE